MPGARASRRSCGSADLTAAAGPVLAVDRRRFLELGGYDPIYFPGRIEDLDLGFRGWMAGYRGYYVPESVAYHRGFGTFESELGMARSRSAGQPEYADLHVEEHGGTPAAGPLALAADPARWPRSARAARVSPRRPSRPCAGSIARSLVAVASWPWAGATGSRGRRRSIGGSRGRFAETISETEAGTEARQRSAIRPSGSRPSILRSAESSTDAGRRLDVMLGRSTWRSTPARAGRAACWPPRSCSAGPCSATCSTWPLELAPEGEPVAVHARPEEHRELRELVGERARARRRPRDRPAPGRRRRSCGPIASTIGRGFAAACAAAARRNPPCSGGSTGPSRCSSADEELTRRLTYQPIGKYWAFPLAQRLAEWLRPTRVRPNAVTMASAALMLAAAAIVAAGADRAGGGRAASPLAMALALVLDTADGRLARLQGTSSAFGRWLDEFLDELADMALHAAIAWSAFAATAGPSGCCSASPTPRESISSAFSRAWAMSSSAGRMPCTSRRRSRLPATNVRGRGIAGLVRLIGHADVRWHLWIVLAAIGRLDVALVAYAVYFPARTLAGSDQEGVAPCLSPGSRCWSSPGTRRTTSPTAWPRPRWADERVVVVDAASRDATLDDRAARGRRRRGPGLRRLRQPAQRRAGDGDRRLGPVGRRRRADHARAGRRDPPGHRRPRRALSRLSRADPQRDPRPPFAFSGTQHDHPLRLFRRDSGRWVGLVHETVDLEGPAGSVRGELRHRTIPTMSAFSTRSTVTRRSRPRAWPGPASPCGPAT